MKGSPLFCFFNLSLSQNSIKIVQVQLQHSNYEECMCQLLMLEFHLLCWCLDGLDSCTWAQGSTVSLPSVSSCNGNESRLAFPCHSQTGHFRYVLSTWHISAPLFFVLAYWGLELLLAHVELQLPSTMSSCRCHMLNRHLKDTFLSIEYNVSYACATLFFYLQVIITT